MPDSRLWRTVPTVLALLLPASSMASDVDSKLAALETAVKAVQSSGNNAWMLVSAALVRMMTGPGFIAGWCAARMSSATLLQSFAMMAVITGAVVGGGLQPGADHGRLR